MQVSFFECDLFGRIILLAVVFAFLYSIIQLFMLISSLEKKSGHFLILLLSIFAFWIPGVVPRTSERFRSRFVLSFAAMIIGLLLIWILRYFDIGCSE